MGRCQRTVGNRTCGNPARANSRYCGRHLYGKGARTGNRRGRRAANGGDGGGCGLFVLCLTILAVAVGLLT